MLKSFPLIIIALILILGLGLFMSRQSKDQLQQRSGISYMPIGDSYTIGNGVWQPDRWPNILVKDLNRQGLEVHLVGNPAVSGLTVRDATRLELPVVDKLKPDFVTVLIGANDNFHGTPATVYHQDLTELLDKLQPMLANSKNIVLVTIPDYTRSPSGRAYSAEKESKSIEEYNKVIKSEAARRDLKVADIFPLSQTMTSAEDYIDDGLHPSAQGYTKWEKVILPVVSDLLEAN